MQVNLSYIQQGRRWVSEMDWLFVRVFLHSTLFELVKVNSVLIKVLFGRKGRLLNVDDFVIYGFFSSLVGIDVSGFGKDIGKFEEAFFPVFLQQNIDFIIDG